MYGTLGKPPTLASLDQQCGTRVGVTGLNGRSTVLGMPLRKVSKGSLLDISGRKGGL